MAKSVANAVLDAALDKVATCTRLMICNAEPLNFADVATYGLADVTLTAGNGNGDYTVAEGDTNGRKLTVAAQTSVPIDTTGTATHASLDDGTTLLYVTTVTSQALTSGGTLSTNAWDIEIADPT